MSTERRPGATEGAIVVHGPVTGEFPRVVALDDAIRGDDALNAPLPPLDLPRGVSDPYARRAELTARARQGLVRIAGLDAVRGVCLLGMNLTFALPALMLLPAWMYHTQYPPPSGAYVGQAGLTWQDIIFPGFLFAMAAAVPIRGSQLVASGDPAPSILWGALKRTALLYVFSLLIGHTNPYYTAIQTKTGNIIAIAGFLTCFALFIRRRSDWNATAFVWIRRAAWLGAAILLFVVPFSWGATFSPNRRDTIITSIAFVYFLCTFIWLATVKRPGVRVLIMLVIAVLKVASPVVGVIAAFWANSAMPWVYEPWFFELLLIALPGTIAGDLLVEWTGYAPEERTLRDDEGTPVRLVAVASLGLLTPVALLVGLYQRHLIATTAAILGIVLVGGVLLSRGRSQRDRLLARMGAWAGALLVAGILLEPLEGGIKKDPQTMGYLLLCAGLWLGVLLAATILIDVLEGRVRRLAEPIILAGQNAMLAYVIFMLFFLHIAYYLGFGDFLSATPAEQAMRGAIITTFVMAVLWTASRSRIVWRS